MREHTIGAYGAAAIALDLLLKAAALSALAERHRVLAVAVVAGALSRLAPVLLASSLPYARPAGGSGDALTHGGRRRAAAALLVALLCVLAVSGSRGLLVAAAVLLLTAGLAPRPAALARRRHRRHARRRLRARRAARARPRRRAGGRDERGAAPAAAPRRSRRRPHAGAATARSTSALSPAGSRAAAAAARALADVELAAVYASPAIRARETAEPLAAVRGLAPILEPALRELDFGDCEGRTFAEIEARYPELYRRWMTEPTAVTLPGRGELRAAARTRAAAAR